MAKDQQTLGGPEKMIPFDKILEDFATAAQIPKDILSGERITKVKYDELKKLAEMAEPMIEYLKALNTQYSTVVITIDGVTLLSTEGYMPVLNKESSNGTDA